MTFSGDEIRTALTAVAVVISLLSLYFSRRSWLQSNRPIVTAFITECHSGGRATTFNLVLSNTGNRPATRVRLEATPDAIRSLIDEDAEPKLVEAIQECFSADSEVPVLRNGENLETAFGDYSEEVNAEKWLKYGAEIPISIRYYDLDGRRYHSKMPLKIYARTGFGGSHWV